MAAPQTTIYDSMKFPEYKFKPYPRILRSLTEVDAKGHPASVTVYNKAEEEAMLERGFTTSSREAQAAHAEANGATMTQNDALVAAQLRVAELEAREAARLRAIEDDKDGEDVRPEGAPPLPLAKAPTAKAPAPTAKPPTKA